MATRQKLPNLKICVDNTVSSDESDVEVEGSDSSSYEDDDKDNIGIVRNRKGLEDGEVRGEDDNDVLSIGTTEPTERRFLSRSSLKNTEAQPVMYGPRIYENKSGNFVTGVDVTSEEALEKRDQRSQRFGTLSTPKQPMTDMDIKNLYKSLGMSTDTLDQDLRGWRTDTILLRGTENMSTKDVFEYFCEYAPKSIEWIDDLSCNVLWQDKLTPARALLKLTLSMEEVGVTDKPDNGQKENNQDGSPSLSRDKRNEETSSVMEINKDSTKVTSDSVASSASSDKSHTQLKLVRNNVDIESTLNLLEDETMELDYDDNLDLTGEDPIDRALSTSIISLSENKKNRTEQTQEPMHKKRSETKKDKEKIQEKDKINHEVIVIKEEKDIKEKGISDGRSKTGEAERRNKKVTAARVDHQKVLQTPEMFMERATFPKKTNQRTNQKR